MSQSAVSHCINDVTEALVKMASQFISYPTDKQTLHTTKQSFHAVANFPNVTGAIDCTHVAIRAPMASEEAFVNTKGISLHTVRVQADCDVASSPSGLVLVSEKQCHMTVPSSGHQACTTSSVEDICMDDGFVVRDLNTLNLWVIYLKHHVR